MQAKKCASWKVPLLRRAPETLKSIKICQSQNVILGLQSLFRLRNPPTYALGLDFLDVRHQRDRISRSRQHFDRGWIHREGIRLRSCPTRVGLECVSARIRILSSAG